MNINYKSTLGSCEIPDKPTLSMGVIMNFTSSKALRLYEYLVCTDPGKSNTTVAISLPYMKDVFYLGYDFYDPSDGERDLSNPDHTTSVEESFKLAVEEINSCSDIIVDYSIKDSGYVAISFTYRGEK